MESKGRGVLDTCSLLSHSSFRGARSASPESITTAGSMDSGPAPSGASTMCNCTSGNDGFDAAALERRNPGSTSLEFQTHVHALAAQNWPDRPSGKSSTRGAEIPGCTSNARRLCPLDMNLLQCPNSPDTEELSR